MDRPRPPLRTHGRGQSGQAIPGRPAAALHAASESASAGLPPAVASAAASASCRSPREERGA
eukprot:3705560-Alexandrium_andersonii.AAC.1